VSNAIDLVGLRAAYGKIDVLRGVDLSVGPGEVYALLGPNGGGKSTTLRVMSGRMRPTAGCVHIAGVHVNGASPARMARAGVCSIPEGRGIFPNLTVTENLWMVTYRGDMALGDVCERAFARFPRLAERRSQVAGTLSGGEQQMLAMARALVTEPAVLLLDEISMGLAPLIVGQLYEVVSQLATDGIAILIVEQFARVALPVADRAAVMTHGRIQLEGTPAEIETALAEAYLGGAA
jgi:branched-chain amino acid transport system ATP-binding protein